MRAGWTTAVTAIFAPARRLFPYLRERVVLLNMASNVAAMFANTLLNLCTMPVLLLLLGEEVYGLLGLFTSLSIVMALCDLGMNMAYARAAAQLSAAADGSTELVDLTKTLELISWVTAALLFAAYLVCVPAIAQYWVTPAHLTPQTVEQVLIGVGLGYCVAWPGLLYAAGFNGLRRLIPLNIVRVAALWVQLLGGIVMLRREWIGPVGYLFWNAAVALLSTLVLRWLLWKRVNPRRLSAKFRFEMLRTHYSFGMGFVLISLLGAVLSQSDKWLLSKSVSLDLFASYAFATMIAGLLTQLTATVSGVLFPQLAIVALGSSKRELALLYHQGCQLCALVVVPISATFILFAEPLLEDWLHNQAFASRTAPLAQLLVASAALNGLVTTPHFLQLAHGWTRLTVLMNLVAVVTVLPLMFGLVSGLGMPGAAIALLVLNLGYYLIGVPLMQSRALPSELLRYYMIDTLLPVLVCGIVAAISRWLLPEAPGLLLTLCWAATTGLVQVAILTIVLPEIRRYLKDLRISSPRQEFVGGPD